MIVCRTVAELREVRAGLPAPVGMVPTMGALHAGHESLVERAAQECAATIVSIYVNPLQFGPAEDFEKYPRAFDADVALLERHGVDALFAPSNVEMYPPGPQMTVDPGALARHLEGARRPEHFRGVATVVLKLFAAGRPDRAYFGQKDAQQLAIVRRLATEFFLGVAIVDCPTMRERDGLALSSRNAYLGEEERSAAPGLQRALRFVAEAAGRGATDLGAVLRAAQAELGALRLDYLAVVDPLEFVPLETLPKRRALLAVGAAYAGATRLIDNVAFETA